jgi:ectoine hydroxylase-related dioxygenase (phytanoyl-CoA dioxygenase family)
MTDIMTRGAARLRRAARRLVSLVHPPEPGVQIDPGADATVIRDPSPGDFLWLDRPSAPDRIEARRTRGELTAEEARLLGAWVRNGYTVMERAIEPALVDAALRDVDRVWNERWHVSVDLLDEGGRRTVVDRCPPDTRQHPYKLNQLHQQSQAIRQIFLHERIVRLMSLIFGSGVVGVNSLTFQFGSQQIAHVDHVYMTPSPPRRMAAAWIALEDVEPDSGPLEFWPGSHRLPAFRFSNPYPYHYMPAEQDAHASYLSAQKHRFTPERFLAKKGDVLLWHSMLAHGGAPIENRARTRFSMACHYFSLECFPGGTGGLDQHGPAWATRIPIEDPD